ncbi:MAG: hypothetical protein RLZZ366_672 [Pseudomonadota bacterium]|jgi:hypothetical protein
MDRHEPIVALAETARFELAVRVTPYDSLANCWFQPLTHVSRLAAVAAYSVGLGRDQLPSFFWQFLAFNVFCRAIDSTGRVGDCSAGTTRF